MISDMSTGYYHLIKALIVDEIELFGALLLLNVGKSDH